MTALKNDLGSGPLRRASLPLALLLAACSSGGTEPEEVFAPLEFRAPIRAMFPGMEDTLIAAQFGRELDADEGRWSSSRPEVVSVEAGGV
ncbi:MAG: hypothetical protein GWN99_10135, partial [Gemmatimonadetes bacterium]|nr:hypothetical protein [Gemmatimonadota bacterium]NIR74654.1 hypothetical protein [Candidatus Kutchimonas denitrificans]NIS01404.1 hypothetical protein [Gemmatimonadota bacterium]NIT67145.1 hypothetical protein [Gemmatimonadota bacterium]NIU52319.1 hypothetical protein [Gemmatimonadota bacterium]